MSSDQNAPNDAPNEAAPDDALAGAPGNVRRPRLLWVAGAVLVILALLGGIAWTLRSQPASGRVPSATAKQAVTGYLEALAANDADRALEYAQNPPTDKTLLTHSVLEASHELGALVIVNVPEVSGGGTVQVPAEVTIGGQPTTIAFSVTQTAPGWRLGQVSSVVDPGALPQSLGPTLNGQALSDTSHLEVFPGLYSFGESAREITLRNPQVVVDAVGEDIRVGLQPTLTSAGVKKANAIAAASLKKCMAQDSANPAGCPNSVKVATGQKINTKTITWSLVGDPWQDATYTLDVNDPTKARGATSLTFRFRATLTQNGETYMVNQKNPPVSVRYLLTVTDAKAPVVWQRVS